MRVLDELADAFHAGRGERVPRPVVTSVGLEEQFGYPVTAARWAAVERRLGCPLPQLAFDQGHWWLPQGFDTVWDLAAHVARSRPDWEAPREQTPAAWREAQVFAGVRAVLVDAGNVEPVEVVRPARLMADLRLE